MPEPTPSYTPTQQRILAKLSDGLPHSKTELLTCFDDPMTEKSALVTMIGSIRKRLQPIGQDIVCRANGGGRKLDYQHIRLLHSPNDGTR